MFHILGLPVTAVTRLPMVVNVFKMNTLDKLRGLHTPNTQLLAIRQASVPSRPESTNQCLCGAFIPLTHRNTVSNLPQGIKSQPTPTWHFIFGTVLCVPSMWASCNCGNRLPFSCERIHGCLTHPTKHGYYTLEYQYNEKQLLDMVDAFSRTV